MPFGGINYYPGDVINRLKERLQTRTRLSVVHAKNGGIKFGDGAALATRRTETKFSTQELI